MTLWDVVGALKGMHTAYWETQEDPHSWGSGKALSHRRGEHISKCMGDGTYEVDKWELQACPSSHVASGFKNEPLKAVFSVPTLNFKQEY